MIPVEDETIADTDRLKVLFATPTPLSLNVDPDLTSALKPYFPALHVRAAALLARRGSTIGG